MKTVRAMNRCPITYEPCEDKYSKSGLSALSSKLKTLKDLPYSAQDQRREALSRSGKMSIQGVQPKLSAKLSIVREALEIVDINGRYIIKPQSDIFEQTPENEDVTMKMAKVFGIEIPLTGLIYSKDGSLSYFIKRFDRYSRNKKYHQEDFAQLTGNTRDTKYNWSMEKLIPVIDNYCTFPAIEKRKLFRRVIFCFLTGNEDMHLKNFSLITKDKVVSLSPAYDLLNSTISLENAIEEFALPLKGKKSKIKKDHLFEYYAIDRLNLNQKVIKFELENIQTTRRALENLVDISFLSIGMKEKYHEILFKRYNTLLK